MPEIIKKNWDIALVLGIGFALAIAGVVGIVGMGPATNDALAAATSVTVTATVSEWLTFSVSTNTASIVPALVSTAGVLATGTSNVITLTAGTNASGGFSITIDSANAALLYGATGTIASHSSGTTTVAVGSDKYGIQASSTMTSIGAVYNYWDAVTIGPASTTAPTLCTNPSAETGQLTDIRFKATTSATKPAGAYSDTIELTCTGST